MKFQYLFILFFFYPIFNCSAQNEAPVVSDLSASVNWQENVINITYDIIDNESDPLEITVKISDNNGKTFLHSTTNLNGDLGYPIQAGKGKLITWDFNDSISDFTDFLILVEAGDNHSVDIQKIVNQVDSNRLYDYLTFIQGIRFNNNANHEAVLDSIYKHFQHYGLNPWIQYFPFNSTEGKNIIGMIPGIKNTSQTIIIDAHYDSVSDSPGADDNGSGVVGVLAAARILSQYSFDKSIKFIGFDLEELGLIGSAHYVSSGILMGEEVTGVLNFEMIGYYSNKPNSQTLPDGFNSLFPEAYTEIAANDFRGDFLISVGNTSSRKLDSTLVANAQLYVPELNIISLITPGKGKITPNLRRSDHASFWDAGIDALMLTDGANFRNPGYHKPTDVIDSLNFTFMAQNVKATIATIVALASPRHGDYKVTKITNPTSIVKSNEYCEPKISARNRQFLTINFQDCPIHHASMQLINLQGRILMERQFNSVSNLWNVNFPVSITTGIYLVRLKYDGKWYSKKILIQ